MRTRSRQYDLQSRRGSLMPGLAIGILVAGGAVALVLDQLWLSTAQRELQTSAQAAALAAGQHMAGEERLLLDVDASLWGNRIRQTAHHAALQNLAVGRRVAVSLEPYQDIRLGREVVDELTGQVSFIETDFAPTSVIVTTHRDRANGNPVSLFMPYLTGQPYGDVVASAEASIINRIAAVRPFDKANVPAWPLAILESDGGEIEDWVTAVELRLGEDQFGWDQEHRQLLQEPDGLPEMILRTGNSSSAGNVCLVDLGSGLQDGHIVSQIQAGLSWEDLQDFGSQLGFEEGPQDLVATTDLQGTPFEELSRQIGQTRIVLLFARIADIPNWGVGTVRGTRLVAVRLIRVEQNNDEILLTVQPTVLTTRTAVSSSSEGTTPANPYIYRLAITQ